MAVILEKISRLREQILSETADCVLYNGWPCLTCISDAVKAGRLPQALWEEAFHVAETWAEDEAPDTFDPWEYVYESYVDMTQEYPAEGYKTQEDYRKLIIQQQEEE